MNIVLVGMMASGKSTVGRLLAETLGRPFIDTDGAIVANAGQTIPEIFAAEGEAGFRAREAAVIAAVAARDGCVVATGGGAVLDPANREALRRTGLVFWLDVPTADLYARAKAQGLAERPLLAGADPLGTLTARADERAGAYAAAAHYRVDAGGLAPAAAVTAILAILHSKGDPEYAAGTSQPC
ncbi:MAG TPA: shikimate kinase [Symbiobacteriaceae bacterium]|nr:shikimate kinase [Symbiobacteriaceae bacterium]